MTVCALATLGCVGLERTDQIERGGGGGEREC